MPRVTGMVLKGEAWITWRGRWHYAGRSGGKISVCIQALRISLLSSRSLYKVKNNRRWIYLMKLSFSFGISVCCFPSSQSDAILSLSGWGMIKMWNGKVLYDALYVGKCMVPANTKNCIVYAAIENSVPTMKLRTLPDIVSYG